MKIQDLTLETSGCASRRSRSVSRLMCDVALYRTSTVDAAAQVDASANFDAATTANNGVHANGTRGFWLAAPIFGTKRTTQWTRPD